MGGQSVSPEITVVPANQATWDDIQTVLGTRGDPARCQCQRYKIGEAELRQMPIEERALRLRDETECDNPRATETCGLVAYLDSEPVGWCALERRCEYTRLLTMPIPWKERVEDRADEGVWAVTCFVTRVGFRKRGVSRALTLAAVDFARSRGAAALEGYPMITEPGVDITWGELHVGSRSAFVAAGFREITHPTKRRFVMRIDFQERKS